MESLDSTKKIVPKENLFSRELACEQLFEHLKCIVQFEETDSCLDQYTNNKWQENINIESHLKSLDSTKQAWSVNIFFNQTPKVHCPM